MLYVIFVVIFGLQLGQADHDFLKGPYANWTLKIDPQEPQNFIATKPPFWSKTTRQFTTNSSGFLLHFSKFEVDCKVVEIVIKSDKTQMKYCNEKAPIFVSIFEPKISVILIRKVPQNEVQNMKFNLTIATFGNEPQMCKMLRKCGDFCLHSSIICPNCLQRNGICKVDQGKTSVRPIT